jgi:hypothetical protein
MKFVRTIGFVGSPCFACGLNRECMSSFNLSDNYHPKPEALIRKVRPRLSLPSSAGSFVRGIVDQLEGVPTIEEPVVMAPHKTIHEFSAPPNENIRKGPETNIGDGNFELKLALINKVQQSLFCWKSSEDANAHLQHFLVICSTFTIRGVSTDAVHLRLFPFSLLGKAKAWFYSNKEAVSTWEKCSNAFLSGYFPLGKTTALRNKISSFQQLADESISEASERLQEYILACPHHRMEEWFIM